MNQEPPHFQQDAPQSPQYPDAENFFNEPLQPLDMGDDYQHPSPLLPLGLGTNLSVPPEYTHRPEVWNSINQRQKQYHQRDAINFTADQLLWGLMPGVTYEDFKNERADWDEDDIGKYRLALKIDPGLQQLSKQLEEKGQNEWAEKLRLMEIRRKQANETRWINQIRSANQLGF